MPLPDEDREWLRDQGVAFTEHVDPAAGSVVVFRGFALPAGKFMIPATDILTKLPPNYPDSGPDMFWVNPPALMAPNGNEARQTQVYESLLGGTWQRWSRHFDASAWRSGVDDIQTVYWRIITAIKEAQ
jgi:hypothetical protein